jgi:hypothetical protein
MQSDRTSQEVFMLKERLKGYIVVEYKWVLLAKLTAACLAVLAVYTAVTMVMDRPKPANAAYVVTVREAKPVVVDMVRPAVMKWMKDNSEMPEQVLSKIYEVAANSQHLDLILAICMVESNFNPNAKSERGAVGLMGILSSVWLEDLKKEGIVQSQRDLYLVSNNIASGVYILKRYLSKSNSLEQALLDYVGGDDDYVGKVMQALGEIYLAKMINVPDRQNSVKKIASGQPTAAEKEAALSKGSSNERIFVN